MEMRHTCGPSPCPFGSWEKTYFGHLILICLCKEIFFFGELVMFRFPLPWYQVLLSAL